MQEECGGPEWIGDRVAHWVERPANIGKVLGSRPGLVTAYYPFRVIFGALCNPEK